MEVAALKDINLVIPDGQFIGLIGHTGSGKSSLIQHLNGLMKPTDGEGYFNGADIGDEDYDRKNLRSQVGLVFQYPEHQLFEVDVFSDVCFGPKNQGLSKKEVELRAYEALRMVGLEDEYFYQSPFDLSGGQKRRVAIAGVIAMKPQVLILDEPTAGSSLFLSTGVRGHRTCRAYRDRHYEPLCRCRNGCQYRSDNLRGSQERDFKIVSSKTQMIQKKGNSPCCEILHWANIIRRILPCIKWTRE